MLEEFPDSSIPRSETPLAEESRKGWIGTDLTGHLTGEEKRESNVVALKPRQSEVEMEAPFYEEPETFGDEDEAYSAFLRRAGIGAGEVSEGDEALFRSAIKGMKLSMRTFATPGRKT